jgi:plasmid stabilization system protein ParE
VLEVEITPRAAAQIERAAEWWAVNRPAAPDAIRTDFQEALLLLSRQPGVGAKSRTARYPDLRRLFLSRVGYHIYYRVKPGAWSCLRFGTHGAVLAQICEA